MSEAGLDIDGVWYKPDSNSIGILIGPVFEAYDAIADIKFEGEFYSVLKGWEFLREKGWIYIGEF